MQLLLHLDDRLVERFKAAVPARQRSAYVEQLLRDALPPEDENAMLERAAAMAQAELESQPGLNEDLQAWTAPGNDGWDQLPPFDEGDLHPHLRGA